jgi:hypothetical protein
VKLPVAWRELGPVPAAPVRAWLDGLDEGVWVENPLRQRAFRVHQDTNSIILIWSRHRHWPKVTTEVLPRWADADAAITPILRAAARALDTHLSVLNVMLARLGPGSSIPPHRDAAPLFAAAHRLHVPVVLPDGVRFEVDGEEIPLRQDHLYEIDNRREHSVVNGSAHARIHLIFDGVPS